MPNLLPDWWPFIRPAGRLIWACLITGVGLAFLVALLRPPVLKRPFPDRVAFAMFPAIFMGTWVLAALVTSLQRTIVLVGGAALVGHAFLLVLSRKPRDPEQKSTWAEAFGGAVAVFALMLLAYGTIPHEWLTFANSYLEWGDNTKFIFQSSQDMLFLPWNWPFSMDYPALRDIVVTGIYLIFLGANLKMFVMWQHRNDVKAPAGEAEAPTRRSRFGRPLRSIGRHADTHPAPAPVGGEGA